MVLIKSRPITPGQRGRVRVSTPDLHKGKPCAALLQKKRKTAGRNNHGRITAWHRGGGSRQHYRLVDFKRNKDGVPAKVERLEYDPNRSAHLALLLYADGERRYIIAPQGVKAGDKIESGASAPFARAMPNNYRLFQSALPCIVWNYTPDEGRNWHGRRGLVRSLWLWTVIMPCCG